MVIMKILLSYCAYPVTTAVFFERALRINHTVTTVGPRLPEKLIEIWKLQNMKLPLYRQDIDAPGDVDMLEVLDLIKPEDMPDLFLWIESVQINEPQNIDKMPCTTACYLIDSHLNLENHLKWAKNFNYVFIAQKEYIPRFHEVGITNIHWLPLAADELIFKNFNLPNKYLSAFVGSVLPGSRRELLLEILKHTTDIHFERCFWYDMARVFSQASFVFNNAIKNDLNMRVFEVLSTGTALFSDLAENSGMDELFVEGEDYIRYKDDTILNDIQSITSGSFDLNKIGSEGQRKVLNAHTYRHRVDDLLDVCFNKKPQTFSGKELRARSLDNSNRYLPTQNRTTGTIRSFVIPVLDLQDNAPYNILSLLDDLTYIDGTVIIVFNDEVVAEEIKNHPRIDRYTIMSCNIGVARAWNVGLMMSETPITFVLNSDVHISNQAVKHLEKHLLELPDAAITGPEGSFFDFSTVKDINHFRQYGFDEPIAVDAVSGFLFCVRTELFHTNTLLFDNKLTPCYFEEWDLGLQIKRAGLKSYIVPTTGYYHEFNIVKRTKPLNYFNREEEIAKIHSRNFSYFATKWSNICGIYSMAEIRENSPSEILVSGAYNYFIDKANRLLASGKISEGGALLLDLEKRFTDKPEIQYQLAQLALTRKHDAAYVYLTRCLEIDPNYKDAQDLLNSFIKEKQAGQ